MRHPRAYLREHRACLGLYAVTDNAWLRGRTLESCCVDAVRGGATFLQLRDKTASSAEIAEEYRRIAAALRCAFPDAQVPFVVNDDMACAQARAALGPDKIVGVSVQTCAQARAAQEAGADYLGVGALIPTPTKPDAAVVSRDELVRICEAVSIPVIGIGGLNVDTMPCLEATGVFGAAVVSAVFAAPDIERAAAALKKEIERVL